MTAEDIAESSKMTADLYADDSSKTEMTTRSPLLDVDDDIFASVDKRQEAIDKVIAFLLEVLGVSFIDFGAGTLKVVEEHQFAQFAPQFGSSKRVLHHLHEAVILAVDPAPANCTYRHVFFLTSLRPSPFEVIHSCLPLFLAAAEKEQKLDQNVIALVTSKVDSILDGTLLAQFREEERPDEPLPPLPPAKNKTKKRKKQANRR
jgi:hypothetical protein